MSDTENPLAKEDQLLKLRNAQAIIAGMKKLEEVTNEQDKLAVLKKLNHARADGLRTLYTDIHRDIFKNWDDQVAIRSDKQGELVDNADKKRHLRKNINTLIFSEENKDTAIYDNNGYVIEHEDIAERLAKFYAKMRQNDVLEYGNRITLDLFITAIGNSKDFLENYPAGIDFRRLSQEDSQALHADNSDIEAITKAFKHSLDFSRSKTLGNKPNGFPAIDSKRETIGGFDFLSYEHEKHGKCLVTANGGLVKLSDIKYDLEREIASGKHIAKLDYSFLKNKFFRNSRIIDYLPNTENLRNKEDIDGIEIKNGIAPFICLNANTLTGLTPNDHKAFTDLLAKNGISNAIELAGKEELRQKLFGSAEDNQRLKTSIEIAYERIGKVKNKFDVAKEKVFAGKTPVEAVKIPEFVMSMGGSGAGKTTVEDIIKAKCGDNFVKASLDDFRKYSDLYQVHLAAGHHGDDYELIEPFANGLREFTKEKAREERYNVLYDGSAAPYAPRYAKITKDFADKGYNTQIVAVDSFLVKPENRQELTRETIIEGVHKRLESDGRILPWAVTTEKHILVPDAFITALQHSGTEKISLFANDGEVGSGYLVAESFSAKDVPPYVLQRYQEHGKLAKYFSDLVKSNKNSVLYDIAKGKPEKIDELMAKNKSLNEENVAYQVYEAGGEKRVLAIYNTHRLIDFYQKAQLNQSASSPEGFLHKKDELKFIVDPNSEKPWQTKLQDEPPPTSNISRR